MNPYCQDRDLLSIEPAVFASAAFPSQQLISGSDGVTSETTFTSAASDFQDAGLGAGMVLCTYTTGPAEGRSYEIISVDSATALTVSVLRPTPEAEPVPPPAGSELSFHVRTFAPQIQNVTQTLSEKLRQIAEAAGIASADFADSSQLRIAAAHGALASVFLARAETTGSHDPHWRKAEYHRRQFQQRQLQLRLAVDQDGDGVAEQTRTLGSVRLMRT